MRNPIAGFGLIAVLAAPPAAIADTLPSRKAGLWESKTISEDGNMTARQCIDEKTDLFAQGLFGGRQVCSKPTVTKTSVGYETATECKIGPISSAGKGIVTGDFASKIRIETMAVLTGLPSEKGPVTLKTVIENTWIGPCEAGQQPGDIILEGGEIMMMPKGPR